MGRWSPPPTPPPLYYYSFAVPLGLGDLRVVMQNRGRVSRDYFVFLIYLEMMGEGQWMSTGSYMLSRYTGNEGPVRI
jgi:hypothetical protein